MTSKCAAGVLSENESTTLSSRPRAAWTDASRATSLGRTASSNSAQAARELVRLLRQYDLPAKVNLIPFNPWPGSDYETSLPERIRAFSDIVFEGGISAPVRTPRGRDIGAACGQLKTAAEKKSRAQRDREAAEAAEEKSAA